MHSFLHMNSDFTPGSLITCLISQSDRTQNGSTKMGTDLVENVMSMKDQAIRELEAWYSLRPSVVQRDRSMVFNNINKHKERHIQSIQQFLNTYRPHASKTTNEDINNARTIRQDGERAR
jgi:hypothetical protein